MSSNDNDIILERMRGIAATKLPHSDNDNGAPQDPNIKPGWRDPECPKCGLNLANRMAYVCRHSHCPLGMN